MSDGHFQRPTTNGVDPRVLADFIVVAARLILIKSHAILPHLELTEEEEEDIAELEERLKLYREFRAAEKSISHLWNKNVAYSSFILPSSVLGINACSSSYNFPITFSKSAGETGSVR